MTPSRRTFLALAAAFVARPAPAAPAAATGGAAFGSFWRLTLPAGTDPAPAARAVGAIVARIDATMSPWRQGSEIARFNAARTREALPLSAETAEVVAAALAVAAETGGAFDPTVGPLVARFGHGPIIGVWARGGAVEHVPGGLRKAAPGVTLDPCGIAKGHAADRIRAELVGLGLCDFLLEMGGETLAEGLHPEGRPWRLGLEAPGGRLGAALALPPGLAAATSGALAQGYALAGHRYGHVVNPAAGAPGGAGLASVTVFDASARRADALSTALFALGAEAGADLARASAIPALFQTVGGRLTATAGAEAHVLGGFEP